MNSKQICFIQPGWITKNIGGAEWQTYLLSNKFVKIGWKVKVVTYRPNNGNLNEKYINPEIDYYYYPLIKIKTFQYFIALYYLLKVKTDIYYTRTDDRIFRAACAFVCKITNRKMVYALAGDDELYYNEYKLNGKKNLFVKIVRGLDYYFINKITKKSEHKANLIITQTAYQQKKLNEVKGLSSVVIPNSYVDICVSNKANNKENIVLWIGNFRPVKHPEKFFEIAVKANDLNYKFLMIGEINGYFKKENLPQNLILTGSLEKEDVLKYLSRAKFIVNTSKTEGFSNTFLEAWMNRTWVISMGVDPDQIIKNFGFGTICPDANEIINVLKRYQDCNLDEKKLTQAKEYVMDNFNIDTNFRLLLDSLKKVM